jgi:transcriptional regulator with XRE-family HTH domain
MINAEGELVEATVEIPFSRLLANLILERNISQKELAQKAGTTQPVISGILHKHRTCGIKVANRLADALGLEGDEKAIFVGRAKQPKWQEQNDEAEDFKTTINKLFSKALADNRVDPSNIKSIIPIPQEVGKGDALIVLKNGDLLECTIKLRLYGMGNAPEQPTQDEDLKDAAKVNGRIYTEESLQRSSKAEIEKHIGRKKTPADDKDKVEP